jgi:hypothetical protein
MSDVDDGETIQVFARVKGPVVLNVRKAPAPTRGRVLEECGDDEIERRAREVAVDHFAIKEQAPMLQVAYQEMLREQRKGAASKKESVKKSPPAPKRAVEGPAKVSDAGSTKKRKLGKKEREKAKAAAEAVAAAKTMT